MKKLVLVVVLSIIVPTLSFAGSTDSENTIMKSGSQYSIACRGLDGLSYRLKDGETLTVYKNGTIVVFIPYTKRVKLVTSLNRCSVIFVPK